MKILKIVLVPIKLFFRLRCKLRLVYLTARGISIGKSTYISPKAYIDIHPPGRIQIGKNCFIARNSTILCHTSVTKGGPAGVWTKYGGKMEFFNVVVGNNVLVGSNSVILPGVSVGDNVIIGSNCVVNKNVPAGKIIGGVPFRIIGQTKELLAKKCEKFDEADWNFNFES